MRTILTPFNVVFVLYSCYSFFVRRRYILYNGVSMSWSIGKSKLIILTKSITQYSDILYGRWSLCVNSNWIQVRARFTMKRGKLSFNLKEDEYWLWTSICCILWDFLLSCFPRFVATFFVQYSVVENAIVGRHR